MNTDRSLTISLKVTWEEKGKQMESVTYYDLDVAKSGDNRQTWLLKNESNHYSLSKTDRRPQV